MGESLVGNAGGLKAVNGALLVLVAVLALAGACSYFDDAPSVDTATLWMDTVERGEMVVERRGPGGLVADESGELRGEVRIPETQSFDIEVGQSAVVELPIAEVEARVAAVGDRIEQGTLTVELEITGELPENTRPGMAFTGIIETGSVADVLYVGKPAYAREHSRVALFKVSADGEREAIRVPVELGVASVNRVVVESGLEEGDKIILSDMSRYDAVERVRLR